MRDLNELAPVVGWELYNLYGLAYVLLGWICTAQILHSISWRRVRVQMICVGRHLSDSLPVSYTHLTLPTIYSV